MYVTCVIHVNRYFVNNFNHNQLWEKKENIQEHFTNKIDMAKMFKWINTKIIDSFYVHHLKRCGVYWVFSMQHVKY